MNKFFTVIIASSLLLSFATAQKNEAKQKQRLAAFAEKHQTAALALGIDQDELAADALELIEEQTSEAVIKKLEEVEAIMGEAIDGLEEGNTGGEIIAAQTEIIEKIFAAAEKRNQESKDKDKSEKDSPKGEKKGEQGDQGEKKKGSPKQGQGGTPGDAMLEMMRRMMRDAGDATPQQGSEGDPKKGKPSQKPGSGSHGGESDLSNSGDPDGKFSGKTEQRTVPRSSGGAITEALPREFHSALDAYNRALQNKDNPSQP